MIKLNPYASVDFLALNVPAISHEHVHAQTSFENCWNRGVRFIPITHYAASIPRYPLTGWNSEYIDWTDETATGTATRTETGLVVDFVDEEMEDVEISGLPSLPNCEKVNMSDFGGHLTCLGSTFGDPGWNNPPTGTPSEGTVTWRQENPLYTSQEMLDNVFAYKLYDKVFITINHPTDDIDDIRNVIFKSSSIKGFEGWNNGYSIAINQLFRDKYDTLISEGHNLWLTAAVDWQDNNGAGILEDLGCNVLMPVAGYGGMTKAQKEQELLNCYDEGRFYASGKMTFSIIGFSASNTIVKVDFSDVCDSIKIITNLGETIITNNVSVECVINGAVTFVRFEAYLGVDFIFTQPVSYTKE